MRGRKPTPYRLKILRGNPGRRNAKAPEPEPALSVPECPDHLKGEARNEWDRMATELYSLGLLSNLDRAALAAYCVAYGRWHDAEEILRKTNVVLVAKGTGNMYPNPYLHIANKAMEQMHKFLTEFGMSPSSRTRVHGKSDKPGDDFEQFLKKKKA
ncbi:MAG: phage terminase small subunit P27 family [Pirellulales bacterium]